MFKVLLARTIYDGRSEESSTKFATLSKEVVLPFAPTLDIEIFVGGIGPTKLNRIRWRHDAANFLCDFEEEFTRVVDGPHADMEQRLSRAAIDGWTLVSVDPLD